ncbi:astacin [Ostertagia ostertagi]
MVSSRNPTEERSARAVGDYYDYPDYHEYPEYPDIEDEDGDENSYDGNEEDVADMITVRGGDGCSSYVGKITFPQAQYAAYDHTWPKIGTAAHELAHALGLIHTHERPDRDDYITVNESNIEEKYQSQFKKSNISNANYTTTPYDYGSVMHYGTKA